MMEYLQDREDPKVFEAKFNAAMAEATKPAPMDKERLEAARQAYAELDENFAPGGVFEKATAAQRFEQEKILYKHHGDRPAPKSPKEAVEEEREAQIRGSAEMANELERWTAQMLEDGGYANIEDARKGIKAPVPSLITTDDHIPAYLMPNGEIIAQYNAAFGKVAVDPRFTAIDERVKKLQQARR